MIIVKIRVVAEQQLFLKINYYCNINCYNHNIYDNNDNNNNNNNSSNNDSDSNSNYNIIIVLKKIERTKRSENILPFANAMTAATSSSQILFSTFK